MIHIIDNDPFVCELASTVASFSGSQSKVFVSECNYLCYMLNDAYVPPDMIFSDVDQPEGIGCTLSRLIKQQYPNVTFILMHGSFKPSARKETRKHHSSNYVDHVLLKPFNVKELIEFVKAITSEKNMCKTDAASLIRATPENENRHVPLLHTLQKQ
ncbi:MAG: hypothetical protein CO186_00515 [Zetaproteobacteria bacterium CG_4_9_14_3_um_filter_49_83]|nr:MAG: hypothetical protein AUJ56_04585 [Zetaproteobacteria bacterium CG1_02_49_23]PIQ33640.1 MAG: hypothetical protein COW62_04745 [Zetaproteobacteria bacterium CG17_big_fil_post_rev_8_21_14_2_50_50_13]PIV30127.1 MAG: hypothetical protein COS35_08355 [Zetaproteobacteria bacterium CG02_land_8_20_14_3_00_50_9]PIY54546.1 MAG: hypothetical protein COZ00_14195 [Zetaproteobacteria bacterium CG_4_10_14_0_8_um_filter_49_80]PJA36459.1 MAG: hypothetical protein CO186_00515 [Zetaproteobacteria bacterium